MGYSGVKQSYPSTEIRKADRGGFITLLLYVMAFLLFISTNSLYVLRGSIRTYTYLCIVAIAMALIFLVWRNVPVSRGFLRNYVVWPALVLLTFMLIGIGSASFGGSSTAIAILLIISFPIFLHLLSSSGHVRGFLVAYCDVSFLFALLSLVLWLLGPVAGLISPNCSIVSTWNAQGIQLHTPGYFGLLYQTQTVDIFGFHFIRNTGVFPEAPMYSYALCIALLFSYLGNLGTSFKNAIVGTTVLTTVSTTGIIVLFALITFVLIKRAYQTAGGWRMLLLILIGFLSFLIVLLILSLFNAKLDSSSGSIRLDDYRAGFLAWQNNPIFGNGLGNSEIVKKYMSGFRSYNLGFSNSPMDILSRGGILFLLVFLIQIIGFLRWPSLQGKLSAGLFIFLWAVTIVTTLPITLLFFSFGTILIMGDAQTLRAGIGW